ncbi:MAG: histidine--tRNA ligase [Pirellulales bacterium]
MIQPRTLKGFRDQLPAQALARENILDIARRVYRSYGFAPIDTPTLEYLEILTGKGSEETDKQLYRFKDHGGREVGMRFDLTVPFARFCAQHIATLGTPFKRYHMATVWRGENTQRGRYREFMQCDFDTIGTTSPLADLETVLVVHDLLSAIGLERFTIRVNDRRVLSGMLEKLDLVDISTDVLRILDKRGKISVHALAKEMRNVGASKDSSHALLEMAALEGNVDSVLSQLRSLVEGSALGEAGVESLQSLLNHVHDMGVPKGRITVDPSIARGLDYYTGIVLESFLDELPELGSICSGGRYDNLAGLYTKQQLPGVGASLGIDRLLAGLEELGKLTGIETPAEVFLTHFDKQYLGQYLKIARALRHAGIAVEFFPECKKLGNQLKNAAKKGFSFALILGSEEFESGSAQLKHLDSQKIYTIQWQGEVSNLVKEVQQVLASKRENSAVFRSPK